MTAASTADGWTLRTEKYRARATDVLTNPEVAERTTLDLMIREELARDVLALCAEIETAREIIASERRRAAHAESLLSQAGRAIHRTQIDRRNSGKVARDALA